MARCTTRKSVHQYPNDSTKPRPGDQAETLPTPMGFSAGLRHVLPGVRHHRWAGATAMPLQPPAFSTAKNDERRKAQHDQEKLQTSL